MSKKKKIVIFFTVSFLTIILLILYFEYFKKAEKLEIIKKQEKIEDIQTNSNIIKDVNYTTKDADGNEYIINALQGEVDFSDPNTLYLTDVKALIKLKSSENITITGFEVWNFAGEYPSYIDSSGNQIDYLSGEIDLHSYSVSQGDFVFSNSNFTGLESKLQIIDWVYTNEFDASGAYGGSKYIKSPS